MSMFIGDNKFFKVLLSANEFALKSALTLLNEEYENKEYFGSNGHTNSPKTTTVYGFGLSKNKENNIDRLGFYMHSADGAYTSEGQKRLYQPFIAPMKPTDLVGQILSWLNTVEYPQEPDIDGDVGKGFYLQRPGTSYYNEHFDFYIDPVWCHYHK